MNFDLTGEQRKLRDSIKAFCEREINPHSARWDREDRFPREVVAKLGDAGLLGVPFSKRWGGTDGDTMSQVLVMEGLSRYDGGIGLTCAAHTGLNLAHIAAFASDEHRNRLLPDLIAGRKLGAWCLTEPGSGSDAAALRLRATRRGDEYVLSGAKMFITNGNFADVYVVMASTEPAKGRGGISAFIVERGAPGLSSSKIEKLGLRSSDTAEVVFDNVAVPARNLIGEPGQGYRQALAVLEGGRVGTAGFAFGIARGALEDVVECAHRDDGGVYLADPAIGEMATRIDAAWVLICRAAALRDLGRPYAREASMAKLFSSETAMWVTSRAIELIGERALTDELPLERRMRDAKLAEIGEGTSEVQRMIIAKSLLRDGYGS